MLAAFDALEGQGMHVMRCPEVEGTALLPLGRECYLVGRERMCVASEPAGYVGYDLAEQPEGGVILRAGPPDVAVVWRTDASGVTSCELAEPSPHPVTVRVRALPGAGPVQGAVVTAEEFVGSAHTDERGLATLTAWSDAPVHVRASGGGHVTPSRLAVPGAGVELWLMPKAGETSDPPDTLQALRLMDAMPLTVAMIAAADASEDAEVEAALRAMALRRLQSTVPAR
ncbi:MAG: hypothetical protein R3F59_15175 [Myxococcota bacterium]